MAFCLGFVGLYFKNKDRVKGKTLLELGAGMGLPSLVAASYTSAVVCSDYLTDALILQKECRAQWHFVDQV